MDSLKFYATNNNELETLLETLHEFTKEISMEFGQEICLKTTSK